MWLVAGLGNPGHQYALTRHNIGFMALDYFTAGLNNPPWNTEQKALTCKIKLDDEPVLLTKPMTFMNKSGESVIALMNYYKIPAEKLIVIHDEIDIAFGWIRIHQHRGPGGHNGIKNISELLGHNNYTRLKLGVGRPAIPEMNVADYVLQKFSTEENDRIAPFLNKSGDALESLIFDGIGKASTLFNGNVLEGINGKEA
jgi:peptidyl-tRNA hydrolase, PTH1 family